MIEETKKTLKVKEQLAALERSRAEDIECLRMKLEDMEKSSEDSIPKVIHA